MNHFRDFSSSEEVEPPIRNIDSDAPHGMRQELIDLAFHLVEHNPSSLNEGLLYRVVCQSLGISHRHPSSINLSFTKMRKNRKWDPGEVEEIGK